jgi:hypothetical protein
MAFKFEGEVASRILSRTILTSSTQGIQIQKNIIHLNTYILYSKYTYMLALTMAHVIVSYHDHTSSRNI